MQSFPSIPVACFLHKLSCKLVYISICLVWQDLATHTRVTPAARQASLVKLAQTINRTPAAKAELDKWGLMIDEKLMEVCVVKSY